MSYCVQIEFKDYVELEHRRVHLKAGNYTYEVTNYYEEVYRDKKTGKVTSVPHHIAIGRRYYKVDIETYEKIHKIIREAKKV